MTVDEGDFMEAIEALGGCTHIPHGAPQRLETICGKCRAMVARWVLLREHYERDAQHFAGQEKKL